jgi:hypothetical protein
MKLQKVLSIVAVLVSGTIAVPFTFQIQNGWHAYNSNNAIVSLIYFLAVFSLMILLGWVKRVRK